MSRFVSVERLSADTLFARATSPEAGLDADARDLAEEPECSSAFLYFIAIVELICLALVLGPVLVLAAVAAGVL